MPRFEQQFRNVMGKRQHMLQEGRVSVPDSDEAPVAILAPYLAERSTDPRDRFVHFLRQANAYEALFNQTGRKSFTILGATYDDFHDVLTDPSIPNLVIAGWGSFSSINVPYSRDRSADPRWGRLEWAHVADMATHVKLGFVIMLHCSGFSQEFNPPLGLGIVSRHSNILGHPGESHWTAVENDTYSPPPPITQELELSYRSIRDNWKRTQRMPAPGGVYTVLQGIWNEHLNPNMPVFANEAPFEDPHQNLTPYRQFFRPIDQR
jgi:hypothetical protein